MKFSHAFYSNKSKLVLARKFNLLGGEEIMQLALLAKNGNVHFFGDDKLYNVGNCEVLTRGIPTKFVRLILYFMQKKDK